MLGRQKKNLEKNKGHALVDERAIAGFVSLSKTVALPDGRVAGGIDVAAHCRIAGYVAEALISLYPAGVARVLFPAGSAFVAAAHDVGKENPDFQKMMYAALSPAVELPAAVRGANAGAAGRKERSFHALVTQVVLQGWRSDAPLSAYIPQIEGMHHGARPGCFPVPRDESPYGGPAWTARRHALLAALESEFLPEGGRWPDIATWEQACVLGGLVIVADWIASGGRFATLTPASLPGGRRLRELAREAVAEAGFRSLPVRRGLSFADVFGFAPRPVQADFCAEVRGPGVYVLEAPMGCGKTEAALYAAYTVLAAGRADGLYFALPTQLTSNKIYERVERFLGRILDGGQGGSLKLLHGAAWLWMEQEFGEEGGMGKSWFDGRKRGLLAPFAVGTVDQALMAVMNVKHGMVRAFGLAGKVVILDEVHSYDAYTGTILNALVSALRQWGCTVILLSATLTAAQKRAMLNSDDECLSLGDYPLITGCASGIRPSSRAGQADEVVPQGLRVVPGCADGSRSVAIRHCTDVAAALDAALEKAEAGEQVLWIENTVEDAQNAYRAVAARCGGGIGCGLVHSRFTRARRDENEDYWVRIYGAEGGALRRERGRVLVGTQVLEQSLDIDADFLITRVCPADMLLQRLGRLWRHRRHDALRPASAVCGALLITPDVAAYAEAPGAFGMSGAVYSEYVLCRTMEVLAGLDTVSLPEDIRPLLERTYAGREERGRLRELQEQMEKKRRTLESFARLTQSSEVPPLHAFSDSKVQTRYSEEESCMVLVARSLSTAEGGASLAFADGSRLFLPKNATGLSAREKRTVAKAVLGHCVPVAERHAPAYTKDAELFAPYVYTGSAEEGERPFRLGFAGDDGYLRDRQGLLCASSSGNGEVFLYGNVLGYQVHKKN